MKKFSVYMPVDQSGSEPSRQTADNVDKKLVVPPGKYMILGRILFTT
jgi:hypothetical protein